MRSLVIAALALSVLMADASGAASLPSDTPASFQRNAARFEYLTREVMIPMRDGVKLKTVIVIPRGAKRAPILLTRTPYNAARRVDGSTTRMGAAVPRMYDTAVASGYIIAVQDIRGKYGSEGDYVVYETAPLTEPLSIAGAPVADLYASTSGTDSDWVVKLIDVWPEEFPDQPNLGGYQLMVSADIFRGRYRTDPAHPQAIPPDRPLLYQFRLPNTSHTFLPGHRVMVQLQSSWFPLYDRNPQKFVPNIFFAKPADYVPATQRVTVSGLEESFIELPVVS